MIELPVFTIVVRHTTLHSCVVEGCGKKIIYSRLSGQPAIYVNWPLMTGQTGVGVSIGVIAVGEGELIEVSNKMAVNGVEIDDSEVVCCKHVVTASLHSSHTTGSAGSDGKAVSGVVLEVVPRVRLEVVLRVFMDAVSEIESRFCGFPSLMI
ncbi:uncharacterized protein VTP21DRAFT_8227 [Calcarisporiella thermophila]|uniref:uncharacterized protein n=1 Tax=Calcarisporiella thermophila TaxID=911321 RepID=UPI003742DAF4